MSHVNCPNCKTQIRSDLDVMTEFLGRVMPPRAAAALRPGQLRELADEALAVARSLGYTKAAPVPSDPDTTRRTR